MNLRKVCLTFLALASVSVTTASSLEDFSDDQRSARSINDDEKTQEHRQSDSSEDNSPLEAGYRFSDDFFLHPAASTKSITSNYEKKATDGCERVIKDSMICMVCKDPKTKSKYEQCSYVSRPNDKSYYVEKNYKPSPSRHRNINDNEKDVNKEEEEDEGEDSYPSRRTFAAPPRGRYEDTSDNRRTAASTASATPNFAGAQDYTHENNERDDGVSDCRRIERNSESCTICKDLRTGHEVERCSSGYKNYKPDDEEEKSYGYEAPQIYSRYNTKSDDDDEEREESPSSLYRSVSDDEDEQVNEKEDIERDRQIRKRTNKPAAAGKSKGCKKIEKESMTCTVCVDPETGGNFEKCSYTHQPNDKIYKFSKSKSFGYPENDEESGDSSK